MIKSQAQIRREEERGGNPPTSKIALEGVFGQKAVEARALELEGGGARGSWSRRHIGRGVSCEILIQREMYSNSGVPGVWGCGNEGDGWLNRRWWN